MKILIATGIYPPEIGGPATYSKFLKEALPLRGIEVSVLSYRTVKKAPKVFRHFWYFLKVIKQGRSVDVIYAQDPASVGLPACLAARILCKKFIVKIVGDYAWEQGRQRYGVEDSLDDFVTQKKQYALQVRVMRWVQRHVALSAYKIVVPSEYLKKIIALWGVDSKKIFIVYNAFEKVFVNKTREELRKKLEFVSPTILSVGRLVPWKGFNTLVEIMSEIRKYVSDARLVIVGDGTQKQELQDKIREMEAESYVTLVGAVSHKEVLDHIVASDVFVLNTQYEGFSHLVLEVMSLGTPIITTSVGGNVEIVKNEENGILVPFNDKKEIVASIVLVFKEKGSAGKMAEKASEDVLHYSTERMLEGVIKVLTS
ncbi:MAG: glycosyltransferase family 4 protein [Candidatus Pacebacteria bacterium]|nr:glycosyltransferase family 4 protein [Candidatus Paceibacterota bacterium]